MYAIPVCRSKLQAPSELCSPAGPFENGSKNSPLAPAGTAVSVVRGEELGAEFGTGCTLPDWRDLLTEEALVTGEFIEHLGKPCFLNAEVDCPEADEWNRHWQSLNGSTRGRLFSLYRRHIRARCVARYVARHFTGPGVYVECGCGSSETSCRLRPQPGQTFLALDFAAAPLRLALRQPCHAGGLQADIRHLPFRDQSLDGLWNLGVMEHFEEDEQLTILREFYRVLKPGGQLLVWWPPRLAADELLLRSVGKLFPDEPGRISTYEARARLEDVGFHSCCVTFPLGDCLTQLVVRGVSPR